MTKDDIIALRTKGVAEAEINKRVESAKLKADVEAYIARGGKINVVASDVRTEQFKPFSISKNTII